MSNFNPQLVDKYFKDQTPEISNRHEHIKKGINLNSLLHQGTILQQQEQFDVDFKNNQNNKSSFISIEKEKVNKGNNSIYKNKGYIDHFFPPNENSLYGKNEKGEFIDPDTSNKTIIDNNLNVPIQWKRISDILQFDEYDIFNGSISSKQIKQGSLGNCYFLSVLAALSEKPYLIYQLFRNKSISTNGLYEIVMFINGQWEVVFIDDYFPVYEKDNTLCFAKSIDKSIWVLILEKAWAKVNGGYINTIGGRPSDALHALTGFSTEVIIHNKYDKMIIWDSIKDADDSNKLICVTSKSDVDRKIGLIKNHAYTIVNARIMNKSSKGSKVKYTDKLNNNQVKLGIINSETNVTTDSNESLVYLLKLRNPWREENWKGEYNKSSSLWNDNIKNEIGYSYEEGTFYVTISELYEYFNESFICHIMYKSKIKSYVVNDLIYHNSLQSESKTLNTYNPLVFNLFLPEDSKVAISLLFRNWRFDRRLKDIERPSSFVISKYSSPDRKISSIECKWSITNLDYVKILDAGFYALWIYIPFDLYSNSDKPIEYIFRICSEKYFISKYLGHDESSFLIQYMVINYIYQRNNSEFEACDSFYISNEDILSNASLECYVAINKTKNKLLRVQFNTKDLDTSNKDVIILPPYDKGKDFNKNDSKLDQDYIAIAAPSNGIVFICFTTRSNCELNFKTKYKFIEYDNFNIQDIDNLLLTDIPQQDKNKEEELNIKTFTYTFSSELRALKEVDFNMNFSEFQEIDLSDLYSFYMEFMTIINDLPQSKDEIKDEKLNKIIWVIVDFTTGRYIGQCLKSSKEITHRGAYIWSSGQFVIGYWINNSMTGNGKLYDTDSSLIYDGEFNNNMKHGNGVLYYKNGDRYEGQFYNNQVQGEGVYYWKGGNMKWKGDFINGKKHGTGILYKGSNQRIVEFNNNFLVEDEKKINNTMSILQSYSTSNNNRNKTKIVKDNKCSIISDLNFKEYFLEKVRAFNEHDSFSTTLLLNILHPELNEDDSYSCQNLTLKLFSYGFYMGEVNEKGYFHGKGVQYIKFLKYCYYAGEHVNGSIFGFGRQYDKNQILIYEGMFEYSFYNGYGKIFYSNGDKYEGEFLNGMRHGKGVYYWYDNSSWSGDFKYDQQIGNGIFHYQNSPYIQEICFNYDYSYNKTNKKSKEIKESPSLSLLKKVSRSLLLNENVLNHNPDQMTELHNLKQTYPEIMKYLLSIPPLNDTKRNLKWVTYENDYDFYIGQINNRQENHGRGCLIVDHKNFNKSIHIKYYIGYWLRDKKYKKGFYYTNNFQLVYEGEFENDKIHGRGRYYYNKFTYYDGYFNNNLKHGKGVYDWRGKTRWEGEFYKDKFNGKGVLIHSNFKIYETAEYEIGNLICKSSPKASNSIENKLIITNKKNELVALCDKEMSYILNLPITYDNAYLTWSQLKFISSDYIGEVNTLGNPHGRGCWFNRSLKEYYIGYFQNGLKEGKGKVFNENWEMKYEGNFKFDVKFGWGRYFNLKNKSFYEGNFDEIGCGNGMFVWEDGIHWKGYFENFKLHGKGKLFNYDQKLISNVEYDNGKIVK